jgi:transposase InsO family protein
MSKARLVITAVTVEKRPVSEVAKTYGVARSWIYTPLDRYRAEGEAAFEPWSRRPKTSATAISDDAADLIVWLRKELSGQGLDAGPQTIAWHLEQHHQVTVSPATVSRCLARQGLVTPDPSKRPKSSYLRFEADMPNECRQSDFTHYRLASGTDTEILTWLDDHSRYALSLTAHARVTGPAVLLAFRAACDQHRIPASTLTDNGMVFTTHLSGSRGGRARREVAGSPERTVANSLVIGGRRSGARFGHTPAPSRDILKRGQNLCMVRADPGPEPAASRVWALLHHRDAAHPGPIRIREIEACASTLLLLTRSVATPAGRGACGWVRVQPSAPATTVLASCKAVSWASLATAAGCG